MKGQRIALLERQTVNGEVAMKNRWWLAGVCLLILIAVIVSMQGLATMGSTKAKPADTVTSPRINQGVQAVSYGDRSGSVPVILPRSGWSEDPPREGTPNDEGRLPDVQADDPRDFPDVQADDPREFPGKDEMYQEEPYEVVPPEDDYLDSMPPEETLPSE
ncbi:MAG TPA: hypothetical protein PLA83_02630 [Deltaproteobacteria bacterium]|mgnify:FL=1|jgi:hypothetical protein|nr:hypothetical protein [Deltaproteobacteria bacterium]